jgi:hypothetical protein
MSWMFRFGCVSTRSYSGDSALLSLLCDFRFFHLRSPVCRLACERMIRNIYSLSADRRYKQCPLM